MATRSSCTFDLVTSLKSRVFDLAPTAVRMFKSAQQERRLARFHPQQTPFGFTLRGSAHQASGEFEPNELAWFRSKFETCEVVVDVGANLGLFSCLAATNGLPVIAIEPLPANLRLLYQNVIDNDLLDVSIFPVALGSIPGIVPLYGSGTGASLIKGWAGAVQETLVAAQTLDSILSGAGVLGRRLLIKMDVEGAEQSVLSGAELAVAADPAPVWMIEINFSEHHPAGRNPDFEAIFNIFWNAGYSCSSIDASVEITPDDIDLWLRTGQRAFGGHNYAFYSA